LKKGINFHQTFPANPAYIGRILSISDGTQRTVREISNLTGIPQGESSGKVNPHLTYAFYMGLLNEDGCTLTELGKTILEEDRACCEELTQWLMHIHLCSASGAEMWNYTFRDILARNHGIVSRAYLTAQMQNKYGVKVNYSPVLSCYTNEMTAIDYLDVSADKVSIKPHRVQSDFLYVYAYGLMLAWEQLFASKPEITAIELATLACAEAFGLTEEQWFSVMEQMVSSGIIRINRQLLPFTVIKLTNTSSLIPRLYSLLV